MGSTEHRYVYDGSNLIYENYGSNTLRFLYDERGLLLSLLLTTTSGTSRYDYVRDIMLNIIGLTDEAGNLVVRYTYDAWGNILSTTGSLASTVGAVNPFRYKGYYYDSETAMYYCQTRYYVPQWCRWLSADHPKYLDFNSPTGLNLYVYCGNNPVTNADPTGHFIILALMIIGALIGFSIMLVKDYQDDGKVFNGSVKWYDYVGATVAGALAGLVVGYIAPLSFTFLVPTSLGITTGGGSAMTIATVSTVAVTVTGVQVLNAVALGAVVMFASDKYVNYLKKKNKMNANQKEKFKREIESQKHSVGRGGADNFLKDKIEEIAEEIMHKSH